MAIPSYGAAPLSLTFLIVRVIQLISMVVILGISSGFVNTLIENSLTPPTTVVATLVITSMATLYTLVSIAFYWAEAHLGLWIMTGVDGLLTIAWVVIAVTVGRPVSYLNCYKTETASNGGNVLVDLLTLLNKQGSQLTLADWSGLNKSNCLETKTIWGFGIILAVTFATSTLLLPTLRYKFNKVGGYAKSVV